MNANIYKLILVTHRNQIPLQEYLKFAALCVAAGVSCVQLREKNFDNDALLTFGLQLKRMLDPLNIPLIVNDDVLLTAKLDASGVHLGQKDGDPIAARKLLGPNKIIGLSIESEQDLIRANQLPINYVAASSIFLTKNKTDIRKIWGIKGLQSLVRKSFHPMIAIGGINIDNVKEVLNAGAAGIAVIGALHDAKLPKEVAGTFCQIITHHIKQNK